ncbi:MAG TPA: nuclear transport factor 2 family protein [Polyangiaceae bacterium]
MSLSDTEKIAIARDYFRLADAGDPRLMELFHEDATFYFPKFGVGHGRMSFFDLVKGFAGMLEWIKHDYSALVFIPCGDRVAVEGVSSGVMNGVTWSGGTTPGGRFCNVFEFRGERIARLHVYLDPDYLGEDEPRFRWGRTGREW